MNEMKITVVLSVIIAVAVGQSQDRYGGDASYKSTNYRPSYEGGSSYYGTQDSYAKPDYYRREKVIVYQEGFKGGRYYFGGHYKGKCYQDGLYFYDDRRFVYCSNGNPYVQPCAPGTRNSGDGSYKPGYYYGYSDFCNVNLVDYGYGPDAYQPYGYEEPPKKDSYKQEGYKVESKTYERSGYQPVDIKRDPYALPPKDAYPEPNDKYTSGKDSYVKETRSYETKDVVGGYPTH